MHAPPDDPMLDAFTLAPGFHARATTCGLKASGRPDLLMVWSDAPCAAAGVFTTCRVPAAPVLLDRAALRANAGAMRAVIANSGCANACTGERGMADARAMQTLAAAAVGCAADAVLVLSTGVIGVPLDLEKVARGVTALTAPGERDSAPAAVRAIMTTDTRPKVAVDEAMVGGRAVALRGFAKGAGMIHPDMATMLAIVTTDARVEPATLQRLLGAAVARSFNRLSVDGDMSTNDTVLLLASGAAGVALDAASEPALAAALERVCVSLARQIARDGEGATRLVEVTVSGAADEPAAHRVADAIARSLLVKTALHGGDPNWGRVLAAAGSCGVELDPARLTLEFGPAGDAVRVVKGGTRASYDEAAAAERLRRDPCELRLDLGAGRAAATVWTCDLSAEYVSINADYTT
jgi:glutamate N-acetyltransferase / amino-acid N-acetyltransferase